MRLSMLTALLAVACGEKAGVSVELSEADADCTWYKDADGDGYADPFGSVEDSCDAPPEGTMAATDGMWDCDDSSAENNPEAEDVCGDEMDNDCDGIVDNECDFKPNDGDWVGTNFEFTVDECMMASLFGLTPEAEVPSVLTNVDGGFELAVWGGTPSTFVLDRKEFSGPTG